MDKLQQVLKRLNTTGLPVTYRFWPEGAAPPLPFLCYFAAGSNNFAADGVVYEAITAVTIELYTKYKDTAAEELVEAALAPFYWEKEETFLESEQCYETIYEIEV